MASQHVSFSAMRDFHACPRMYYYKRVLRRELHSSQYPRPLGFGLAFHAAQELVWTSQSEDAVLGRWADQVEYYRLSAADAMLGELLLIAYMQRWDNTKLTWSMEPIVEERIEVPVYAPGGYIEPDISLVAVFDARAFNSANGETVVIEHKTTASSIDSSSPYWTRLETSQQLPIYAMILADHGHERSSILLDVIRAPVFERNMATPFGKREFYLRSGRHRHKTWKAGDPKPGTYLTDESVDEFRHRMSSSILTRPDDYFQRRIFRFSPDDMSAIRADIWQTVKLLLAAHEHQAWPRNMPDACHRYREPCAYLPVCTGQTDIENQRLYNIRTTNAATASDGGLFK